MKIATVASVLALVAALLAAQDTAIKLNPRVRVFFWTDRPTILGIDQKDREDSVADLKGHIDKDVFELARSKDEADLTVEVVRRGLVPTGNSSSIFGGLGAITVAHKTPIIQVTIRLRDYSMDLTCDQGMGSWGDRARACDNTIRKWALDNLSQIHKVP